MRDPAVSKINQMSRHVECGLPLVHPNRNAAPGILLRAYPGVCDACTIENVEHKRVIRIWRRQQDTRGADRAQQGQHVPFKGRRAMIDELDHEMIFGATAFHQGAQFEAAQIVVAATTLPVLDRQRGIHEGCDNARVRSRQGPRRETAPVTERDDSLLDPIAHRLADVGFPVDHAGHGLDRHACPGGNVVDGRSGHWRLPQ